MSCAQVAEDGSADKRPANPIRGEAAIPIGGRDYVLRPTFTALVAAEEELGSLFALVERAGEGRLRLAEVAALFWHCLAGRDSKADGRAGGRTVGKAHAGAALV